MEKFKITYRACNGLKVNMYGKNVFYTWEEFEENFEMSKDGNYAIPLSCEESDDFNNELENELNSLLEEFITYYLVNKNDKDDVERIKAAMMMTDVIDRITDLLDCSESETVDTIEQYLICNEDIINRMNELYNPKNTTDDIVIDDIDIMSIFKNKLS